MAKGIRNTLAECRNIFSSATTGEDALICFLKHLTHTLCSTQCRLHLFVPAENKERQVLSFIVSQQGEPQVFLCPEAELKRNREKGEVILACASAPEQLRLKRRREVASAFGEASPLVSFKSLLKLSLPFCRKEGFALFFIATDKTTPGGYTKRDMHMAERVFTSFSEVIPLHLRVVLAEFEKKQIQDLQHFRDQLTFMIVHDLKGPLSEVMANLDLLQERVSTKEGTDILSSASVGCRNLWAMIMDLLDLAKLQEKKFPLKKEMLSLEELLQETISTLEKTAKEKSLTVSLKLTPPSLKLEGDRTLLKRVFTNLLLNAVQYSPENSSIEIEAKRGAHKSVFITFQDHGQGIHPEDIPLIFNTFAQGRGNVVKCSTGLGLTLCKLGVEAHKGNIRVESTPGKGSCFCVSLPVGGSRAMIDL